MDPVRVPKTVDKLALAKITFDFPAWKEGRVRPSEMRCLVNDGNLPDQTSAAVRQELARLKGNWRVLEMNGQELPAGEPTKKYPAHHVSINGESLKLRWELLGDGGKIKVENGLDARLEVDPAGPVKRIMLVATDDQQNRQMGVYETDGKMLRISMTTADRELGNGQRPLDFRCGPFSQHAVWVLRRE